MWTCHQCGQSVEVAAQPIRVKCICGYVDVDPTVSGPLPVVEHRIRRWARAVKRWIKAGRPRRTEADALLIIETQCKPCDFFKDGVCTHSKCGCSLTGKGYWISRVAVRVAKSFGVEPVMFQKVRMRTENCPIGKW